MKLLRIALCVLTVVFFTACDRKESKTINMARANWDTGYFHAEIYKIGLEKLGYEIPKLKDVKPGVFYVAAAAGEIFGIRAGFTGSIGVYGTDANWGHWSGYLVG